MSAITIIFHVYYGLLTDVGSLVDSTFSKLYYKACQKYPGILC